MIAVARYQHTRDVLACDHSVYDKSAFGLPDTFYDGRSKHEKFRNNACIACKYDGSGFHFLAARKVRLAVWS